MLPIPAKAAALALLVGCYSASPAPNVPCSEDLTCPSGQMCDLARNPPLCVSELVDAAVDAAQPCTVTNNTCPATSPICDPMTLTCRRCIQDSDCTASNACSESAGTCVAEPTVLYVETTGDDGNPCTRTSPCATLARALALVTTTRDFIRVGPGSYATQLQVMTSATLSGPSTNTAPTLTAQLGPTVTVLGAGVTLALETLQIVNGNVGIEARTGTTLKLYGVTVDGAGNQGISAQGAIIEVRRSSFTNNQRAIETQSGSSLLVTRSLFKMNRDTPIHISSSSFEITSSLFIDNDRGLVIDGSLVAGSKLEHNTLVGTKNDRAVRCNATGVMIGNSIFFGNNAPQVDTQRCSVRYSLVSDELVQGSGNLTGDPGFIGGGNYHLNPTSKAIDAADPLSTEPTDFDGQARPRGPRRDLGAFEY